MQVLYGNLKSEADADQWQMGVGMLLFGQPIFLEGETRLKQRVRKVKGGRCIKQAVQKQCGT